MITCDTQPLTKQNIVTHVNSLKTGAGDQLAADTFVKMLSAIEKLMDQDGPFFLGSQISIADVAIVAQLFRARWEPMGSFFSVEKSFPRIFRLEKWCFEAEGLREVFEKAHPFWQEDCEEGFKNKPYYESGRDWFFFVSVVRDFVSRIKIQLLIEKWKF